MLVCCVVSLSCFPMALLSPFVSVMSVAVFYSSNPPLKAVILSPTLTVCLMFGPLVLVLLCDISCIVFLCYLSILHAFSVLLPCCTMVILPPSVVLSLHYLSGYLSAVVPRVIVCHDQGGDLFSLFSLSILKCSRGCRGHSFSGFLTFMDNYWELFGFHLKFLHAQCQNIWFSTFVWLFTLLIQHERFIAFSWMYTFSCASNTLSSKGCLCFCQWLRFVYFICVWLCLHGCKPVLLHLIQSMAWFIADGCLLREDYDSRRKLKLRAVDRIEKRGKTRDVITIKPFAQ